MRWLRMMVPLGLLTALLVAGGDTPAEDRKDAASLISVRVDKAPALDGKADDEQWSKATPLKLIAKGVMPSSRGKTSNVEVRSVHTGEEVFFLVVWDDESENVSHKTWVWNKEKDAYEEGKDREDMFALAFEHTGPFVPDMFAPVDATWDVWHWKAFRTNPHGYAMDKTHVYSRSKPDNPKAKMYKARDGKEVWIARPEDAGDTVEVKVNAPKEMKGERVPQFKAGKPTGSAADVRAKGAWHEKKWTLEAGRKLDTGHKDDTAFDVSKTYKMSLAPFDATGDMDKATGLIVLSFKK